MKKIVITIFVFFTIGFPAFSQQQIGNRLRYEIESVNIGNYVFRIRDVYDNSVRGIFINHEINDIYNISYNGTISGGWRGNINRIGAANLYTNEFSTLIVNNLRTLSQIGGHPEWQTHASTIAMMIQDFVRSQHGPSQTSSTDGFIFNGTWYSEYDGTTIIIEENKVTIRENNGWYVVLENCIWTVENNNDYRDNNVFKVSGFVSDIAGNRSRLMFMPIYLEMSRSNSNIIYLITTPADTSETSYDNWGVFVRIR